MSHSPMPGKPDLTLHTLIHFLDRFVYRNPKKSTTALRGSSIMQPLAGGDSSGLLVSAGATRHPGTPVNDESFYKKSQEEVAKEEVFFHNYFSRVAMDKKRREKEEIKKKKAKKSSKTGQDGDADSDADGSDADEADIWEALVQSRPELENAGDSGDDLDLDDLESAMDSDNDEDGSENGKDEGVNEKEGDGEAKSECDSENNEKEEDEGEDDDFAKFENENDDGDDDDNELPFNLDAASEDEAFVDSDAEVPEDISSKLDALTTSAETAPSSAEPEAEKKPDSKRKRRKLKQLPTFASADDYVELLKDEDEGM